MQTCVLISLKRGFSYFVLKQNLFSYFWQNSHLHSYDKTPHHGVLKSYEVPNKQYEKFCGPCGHGFFCRLSKILIVI